MLRFEQVSLLAPVGTQYLLREISFTVAPGDRWVLVGISGAGKTSLLKLCNRLHELSTGAIYLDQQRIQSLPVQELRQRVILVGQEPKLLGMTVQEALTYPLTLRRLPPTEIQQRLTTWIEKLQIPLDWLHRTELQLSLGQRQWVAIARGLLLRPQILLLDEPTAGLDVQRVELLFTVLTELSQQSMPVLLATHQLEVAAQFGTHLLGLHQGQCIQSLTCKQVNWAELQHTLETAAHQSVQEWQE